MKRRDFLKSAAIAPAALAASGWAPAGEAGFASGGTRRITAVLYDERYADCRLFAEALARHTARLFATGADAARVWYGGLAAHLERNGGSVAGITADSDWGVSRGCGRELRFVPTYEGSHDSRASNRLVHLLRGNGKESDVYAALLRAEMPWPEAIAEALMRPPGAQQLSGGAANEPIVTSLAATSGHPGYLTSWLLEPRETSRGFSAS